ncbi:hypothetical protein SynPROSU1_00669 [Synechococcus sp. PROS-U-1]|nr:hypothetical protein SynPROSU1_00669 [Synechococcus sp. PROS-U-1]
MPGRPEDTTECRSVPTRTFALRLASDSGFDRDPSRQDMKTRPSLSATNGAMGH